MSFMFNLGGWKETGVFPYWVNHIINKHRIIKSHTYKGKTFEYHLSVNDSYENQGHPTTKHYKRVKNPLRNGIEKILDITIGIGIFIIIVKTTEILSGAI